MSDGAEFGGAADLIGGAATGSDAGAAGAGTTGAGQEGGAGGGAAGGAGDGGQGGDGTAAPDWFGSVSDKVGEGETASNRDWLGTKGFKDLDSLVKSYREAEKGLRDGGRIKVPGEGAEAEEVTAFHRAIGVPEKADGYEIKGPEGVQLNDAVLGQLAEAGVKHGIPKAAFEGIVSDFIQIQIADADADRKRQDGLAAEWVKAQGAKADEQQAFVTTAARALQLTKADMQGLRSGLGADRALGLLAKLGAGMAEDVMITGGSNRFGVSGAEAKTEMDRLKGDTDFMAKAVKEGTPERARWDRLNRLSAEYEASKAA